jgi:hypothetical protein
MGTSQPVPLTIAVASVLSTGVALVAVLWPDRLTVEAQAAIIAFGNSLIALGAAIWLNKTTTAVASPELPAGSTVKVSGTRDTVEIQPTPPGPTGNNEGAE